MTATERTHAEVLRQELRTNELLLAGMQKDQAATTAEVTGKQTVLSGYRRRLASIKAGSADGSSQVAQLKSERQAAVALIDSHEVALKQASAELIDVQAKIADAQDHVRRSKRELSELEAIENMKRVVAGVHGRLVDLCQPVHKRYAQAISVAAGRNMDAIVVSSKQVASECIEYLKEQRIGRCLFLPLDNIKVQPVPERLRTLGSKYKVCADLLQCEEAFKPAVLYAVGSSIVCESLEDAQELCFQRNERVKAVTLKGQVIGKTGAMTGGGGAGRESSEKWREAELVKLMGRKAELDDIILAAGSNLNRQLILNIDEKLHRLESDLQYASAEQLVLGDKERQTQGVLGQLEGDAAKRATAEEKCRADLEQLRQALDQTEAERKQIEDGVFSSFVARVGSVDLHEQAVDRHERVFVRLKEISDRLTDLRAHKDYEHKRSFDNGAARLAEQAAAVSAELGEVTKEKQKLLKDEDKLQAALKKLADQAGALKTEEAAVLARLKELSLANKALDKERDGVDNKLSAEEIGESHITIGSLAFSDITGYFIF